MTSSQQPGPDPRPPGTASATARARPRFSVVIPAYNEAVLLPACLSSLASQAVPGGVEVVVVDNNSTDATAAIAARHGARVVREARPGVCFARHRGTLAARGEIIVSTDADTVFDPAWLARIDAAFTADPALVAVAGPCRFVDAPAWGRWYSAVLFGSVHLLSRASGRVLYVTATNIAFRRTAWTGYELHATQGGDELGLLRALRARGKVRFDRTNPTFTSARRLRRGLLYNLVVTCFFFYLLGYGLNRLTGRTVVGTAPHVRPAPSAAAARRRSTLAALAAAALWVAAVLAAGGLITHLVEG